MIQNKKVLSPGSTKHLNLFKKTVLVQIKIPLGS